MTRQEIPPWVIVEAEKKPRRKPGPKPKPVEPEPKLHVKVNLSGSVAFDLEGDEAIKLRLLLRTLKLDEILEFVDPWASGAELRYEVGVTELNTGTRWVADEAAGTIESLERDPWIGPYWIEGPDL